MSSRTCGPFAGPCELVAAVTGGSGVPTPRAVFVVAPLVVVIAVVGGEQQRESTCHHRPRRCLMLKYKSEWGTVGVIGVSFRAGRLRGVVSTATARPICAGHSSRQPHVRLSRRSPPVAPFDARSDDESFSHYTLRHYPLGFFSMDLVAAEILDDARSPRALSQLSSAPFFDR